MDKKAGIGTDLYLFFTSTRLISLVYIGLWFVNAVLIALTIGWENYYSDIEHAPYYLSVLTLLAIYGAFCAVRYIGLSVSLSRSRKARVFVGLIWGMGMAMLSGLLYLGFLGIIGIIIPKSILFWIQLFCVYTVAFWVGYFGTGVFMTVGYRKGRKNENEGKD